MDRRAELAAKRADLSGSGPTRVEAKPARFPGATSAFALLGEVLQVGILVGIVGIAVVTLPAGLAAGIRHLRRYVRAEDSSLRLFWRDLRNGLPGGIVVGAAAAFITGLLLVDLLLASSGGLPGGELIAAVGWLGLAAVSVSILLAAAAWSPELGWRGALRSVPRMARADGVGVLYALATALFVVVVTWTLPPLVIPALGCAALAIVAIPERRNADADPDPTVHRAGAPGSAARR